MTDLSNEEKRLLTLAMGLLSLFNIIMEQDLSDETQVQCEEQFERNKVEYEKLFVTVDQKALIKKLETPYDATTSPLADRLRAELLDG